MNEVVIGIIEKNKKYLLVSTKADYGRFTGFYYPPGGHIEKGEDEITALKREMKEELGLVVESVKKITTTSNDMPNQITHWYLCTANTTKLKINYDELNDAGYFSEEDILKMKVWPTTVKVLKQYIF